uniref:Uncharacterized protein n=1 Tax=Rhizophagus irregularis (strain DAOM 181602 / DAOM 197198 / MUCL 43194) TaxID=747089 RepID=U9TJN6_RHIID
MLLFKVLFILHIIFCTIVLYYVKLNLLLYIVFQTVYSYKVEKIVGEEGGVN